MDLILASKSPRRRDIVSSLGLIFTIQTADADEALPEGVHPREGVVMLAIRKGEAVAPRCARDAVILSSDTLVELDGVPLGKPIDADDARRMLHALSGRTHRVHTGIAVRRADTVYADVATTSVTFRTLSEEEIDAYIATGEPMDKAGAYGIQGAAGAFVLRIDGDLDTVVGLSTRLTCELLSRVGIRVPREEGAV